MVRFLREQLWAAEMKEANVTKEDGTTAKGDFPQATEDFLNEVAEMVADICPAFMASSPFKLDFEYIPKPSAQGRAIYIRLNSKNNNAFYQALFPDTFAAIEAEYHTHLEAETIKKARAQAANEAEARITGETPASLSGEADEADANDDDE